jgi:hypothetical protein
MGELSTTHAQVLAAFDVQTRDFLNGNGTRFHRENYHGVTGNGVIAATLDLCCCHTAMRSATLPTRLPYAFVLGVLTPDGLIHFGGGQPVHGVPNVVNLGPCDIVRRPLVPRPLLTDQFVSGL